MKVGGLRVTVAGAGIGGAATALLFARAGAEVTVLERVRDPSAVGAGILLQPNGLAVLYGVGLQAALREHGFVDRVGVVRNQAGNVVLSNELPDFGDGLDHFLAVRRTHLFSVLIDALRATPGIDLRFGEALVSVDPDASARLSSAAMVPGDLFVGADGVHSVARESLRLGEAVTDPTTRYLRAVVDGSLVNELSETWTELGLFGSAPIGDGTYFFCGTSSAPVRDALGRGDLDALRDAWSTVFPPGAALLEQVRHFDELLLNDVVTAHCDAYHSGSAALIGDAAHAMAPNAGQGANSALVDAAVLLACVRKADDVPRAVHAFTKERLRQAVYVQRLSGRLARLARVRSGPGRWLRDATVRVTAPIAGSRRQLDRLMQEPPSRLLAIASV